MSLIVNGRRTELVKNRTFTKSGQNLDDVHKIAYFLTNSNLISLCGMFAFIFSSVSLKSQIKKYPPPLLWSKFIKISVLKIR